MNKHTEILNIPLTKPQLDLLKRAVEASNEYYASVIVHDSETIEQWARRHLITLATFELQQQVAELYKD